MHCLTYTQLKKMLSDANWAHDMYWELGMYEDAIRYTKIGLRILQAITNQDNKLNYWK